MQVTRSEHVRLTTEVVAQQGMAGKTFPSVPALVQKTTYFSVEYVRVKSSLYYFD